MNEKKQEQLVELFQERFRNYNQKVLQDLGEKIKLFSDLTPSQAYKLGQQLKYDKSINELIKELSKESGKSVKEIKKILEKTAKENIQFADVYYKSKNMTTPVYKENKALQKIVNATAITSGGMFKNIAKTTGFRLKDKDGNPLLLDINKTYNEVIDRCIYAISEGKDTYYQSMRNTINQLADSGVRKIEYESGYSQRLDSAVRRNILDGVRQVSNETNVLFGEEFGADGVEITVHENPAPDHELVQGRQFRKEQFENFQNDLTAKSYDGIVFEPEFDGHDRRSISEYNCYHAVRSVILGVNKPLYNDKQLNDIINQAHKEIKFEGKKYTKYEATQLQRRIETEIRYAKDEQIINKASGDTENILLQRKKITQLTTKYKKLCKVSGLDNQLSKRARVSGYKR